MDCPQDVFFTQAAFEQYAVQPTFLELLQKYAPQKDNVAKQGKRIGGHVDIPETTPQQGKKTTLRCPKPGYYYPHYSCLTHDQHRRYLQLESKYSQHSFQGRHTQQELHELREFRQYQTQVANEQREFQRFAETLAKNSKDDYSYLHPLCHAYIKGVINQWKNRLKDLPQNYALYQTIGMGVEPVVPSDPVLKHMACLLSLGEAPSLSTPPVNPHDPPVLHHMVSVMEGTRKSTGTDSMEFVSDDVNAKKLAEKYHANIVVSFPALEMMLDTHPPPYEQQWEIPITVSENTQGDGASSTNIIFIDKPLKQKVIFPHEASSIFHKISLIQMLNSDPNKPHIEVDSRDERVDMFLQGGVEFSAIGDKDGETNAVNLEEPSDALMDLETFGSGLMFPLPKKVNQCKETVQSDSGEKKQQVTVEVSVEPIKSETVTADNGNKQVSVRSEQSQMDAKTSISTPLTSESTKEQQTGIETSWSEDSKPTPLSESDVPVPEDVSNQLIVAESPMDSPQSPDPVDETLQIDVVQDSQLSPVTESPQSPDPGGKTLQTDVLRDSPQSPVAESPQSPDPDQTDVVRDSPVSPNTESPQSTEPVDKTLQTDVVQDSPISPDPGDKTLQIDVPQDSPQSPVAESPQSPDPDQTDVLRDSPLSPNTESPQSPEPVDKTLPTDVVQDSPLSPDAESPQSPDPVDKTLQTDVVRDSPLSPDAKSNSALKGDIVQDSKSLQSPNVEKETLEQADKDSPESPDSKIPSQGDSIQGTNNDYMLLSPPRKQNSALNVLTLKDSSASEGELMIASADDATIEETQKQRLVQKEAKKPIKSGCKGQIKTPSPTSQVQTRRSKRFKTSLNSDESEDEDDIGIVTRRRSARLRKADGSPPDLPAKKIKKTDKGGDTEEHEGTEQDNTVTNLKVKTTEKMDSEKTASESVCESSVAENVAQDCDSVIQSKESKTSQSDLEPKTSQSDTTACKSSPSKTTQPATTKRTNSTPNTTLTAKKPRIISKGQQKKDTKLGGVSSTIDTIMKLQEQLHTRRQQKATGVQGPSDGGSVAESNQQNPTTVKTENPADYVCPKDGNLSYNLWKLGKLNILVRTRDHGTVKQGDSQQNIPVTVIPKLEYQFHFGFEQMGLSELCQIWANLFIRPGSKVIRGRVNAFTSQLLKLEWLDLSNPLWMQCPLNPARSMKMVHAICDKLQGLPKGKYLLSHNPGDTHASVHLALERGSKKRVTYDLHKAHAASALQASPPSVLPWLPLDPKVPLTTHLEQNTIPLTFPPKLPGMKINPTGPLQTVSKKKKKGNKKKNNAQAAKKFNVGKS